MRLSLPSVTIGAVCSVLLAAVPHSTIAFSMTNPNQSSVEQKVENDYNAYEKYEMEAKSKVENDVQLSAEKLVEEASNQLVEGREAFSSGGGVSSQMFVSSTTTDAVSSSTLPTTEIDFSAIERSVEAQVLGKPFGTTSYNTESKKSAYFYKPSTTMKDIETDVETMVEDGITKSFGTPGDEGIVTTTSEESENIYFSKPSTLEDGPVVTSIVPGASPLAPLAPVAPATPVKQPLTPEAIASAEKKVESDMVRTRADERVAEESVEKGVEEAVEKPVEIKAVAMIEEKQYKLKGVSTADVPVKAESKPFTPLPDVGSDGSYLDALSGTGSATISGSGQVSYLNGLKTQNVRASSGSGPVSYLDSMSAGTSSPIPALSQSELNKKVETDVVRTRADERAVEQMVEKDIEASVEKSVEVKAVEMIEGNKYTMKGEMFSSPVEAESKPSTSLPAIESNGSYLDALSGTVGTAISGSGSGQSSYLDALKTQNSSLSSGSGPVNYLDNMSTSAPIPFVPEPVVVNIADSKPISPLPNLESNGSYLDALSGTAGAAISGSGQGNYLDALKTQNTRVLSGSGPGSYLDTMSASTSTSEPLSYTPESVVTIEGDHVEGVATTSFLRLGINFANAYSKTYVQNSLLASQSK